MSIIYQKIKKGNTFYKLYENFPKELFIDKSESQDLSPIFFGAQACTKNHSFGPHTRNYYIIHFCLCGCGKLQDKFGERY